MSTILPNDGRMKPIIIVPPDVLSADDLQALRDNGLCVVVAKDPNAVKFLDPIPAVAGRDKIEQAAIDLSRKLLDPQLYRDAAGYQNRTVNRADVAKLFTDLLIAGTALDAELGRKEQVRSLEYDEAFRDEVRKIAREDARAERAKKKEAKSK